MSAPDPRVEVQIEGAGPAQPMTVDQFLFGEDPDSSVVDPEAVAAMEVGQILTFGGGAAPFVTVRRVA